MKNLYENFSSEDIKNKQIDLKMIDDSIKFKTFEKLDNNFILNKDSNNNEILDNKIRYNCDSYNNIRESSLREFDLQNLMPKFFSTQNQNVQIPYSNNLFTLNDKENNLNSGENVNINQKEENQLKNLEFLNTLIRLKSSENFKSPPTNTFFNNDDSRLYLKELVDLCNIDRKQSINFNDLSNNCPFDENLSFLQNRSSSNTLLKINSNLSTIAPCNYNSSLNFNYHLKNPENISNNKKPQGISTVNSYLNRRHNEELSKIEKIKKEKIEKENAQMKNIPQINKNSRKIAEKLSSKPKVQHDKNNNLPSISAIRDLKPFNNNYQSLSRENNLEANKKYDKNSNIQKFNSENNLNEIEKFEMLSSQNKKTYTFTKRLNLNEPVCSNSLKNNESEQIPCSILEKEVKINNNLSKNKLNTIDLQNCLNNKIDLKPLVHYCEIGLFEKEDTNKKRFYFKDIERNENIYKNNILEIKGKLLLQEKESSIGVLKSPDSYSMSTDFSAVKSSKLENNKDVKSPTLKNKNKYNPVEELFKLHSSENNQIKIKNNDQIDDLMNSIAQYNNKIGLQSNYLSSNNNDAKSSEAKNFTSNLMNDNLPKMNSTESINNSISLGKSQKTIKNNRNSKANIIYVDLRKVDEKKHNHNYNFSKRSESVKSKENVNIKSDFAYKNRDVVIRSSLRDGLIKITTKRKMPSFLQKESDLSSRSFKSINNSVNKSLRSNFSNKKLLSIEKVKPSNKKPQVKIKSISNNIQKINKHSNN